ncbi:MAG: DUF456 domain-containing protein [Thermodesulfobacteriota bacterium]
MISAILVFLGILLLLAGFVGCVVPVIPGPALAFTALIILCLAKGWATFSGTLLVVLFLFAVLVSVLDTVMPLLGAKRFGATKKGLWGSILGMTAGVFIAPPWTIILGAFLGAVAGEMLAGKEGKEAAKAGLGVFLGTMAAMGAKLLYVAVASFYYLRAIL